MLNVAKWQCGIVAIWTGHKVPQTFTLNFNILATLKFGGSKNSLYLCNRNQKNKLLKQKYK